MIVRLRIEVDRGGSVRQVTIEDQQRAQNDPIYRALADSAKRAVERSSPLALPPGKYEAWREMVLNFDPENASRI
jgi:predicted AlkP superfamily phosphohydrolase/phosphomutase